jgi:phosphoglycerate dehydrogenase-like enzyme
VLTCSRGSTAIAISEFVLAAMLNFEKRLPELWARPADKIFTGASLGSLDGRCLGVVGFGGIGTETAIRAQAFGMSVVAARRHPERDRPPGVRTTSNLDEVLASADHLVVAAPATPQTRHIIGDVALRKVNRGLHLINVARGSLVDQAALRVALDDGRVARATLDVCDPEPLPHGHWLYMHPNVRLTGHVSWAAPSGTEPLIRAFLDNLVSFRNGEPLFGVVDPAERY